MEPELIFNLIVFIILFGFVFDQTLGYINSKNWKERIPEEMKGVYDEEKYKKARHYEKTRDKFGLISSGFSLLLILLMLFLDGFAFVDALVKSVTANAYLVPLLFFAVIMLAADVFGLPFSIYSTFVIEEKFGFNKTTVKTFILDKIKGVILAAVIGGGLFLLFIWLYENLRDNFWWMAWIVLSVFSIFMAMFYTSLIVPIFNKLSPLPEGSLRNSIQKYCSNNNFDLTNLFVIDGSKRSSKSNAYFSGLGRKKTIVLFDTLIEQQEDEEIVAVLAHEIGHYKLKHSRKTLVISLLQTGLMLYLLSLFLTYPVFGKSLGVEDAGIHIGLICFSLLYSPISMISGILMNMLSRKHEFEADAFATKTNDGNKLISALKKLSVENLSNLHPHPLYVFLHYSHPPILQRIESIRNNISSS